MIDIGQLRSRLHEVVDDCNFADDDLSYLWRAAGKTLQHVEPDAFANIYRDLLEWFAETPAGGETPTLDGWEQMGAHLIEHGAHTRREVASIAAFVVHFVGVN